MSEVTTRAALKTTSRVYEPVVPPVSVRPFPASMLSDGFYMSCLFFTMGVIMLALVFFYGPARVMMDGPILLPATSIISDQSPKEPAGGASGQGSARVADFYRGVLAPDETLSLLALRHRLSLGTLLSVNKIDDLSRVRPGLRYTIPGMDGILHRVSRGQTLEKISDLYGISMEELSYVNGLLIPQLHDGQELFIPGKLMSDEEIAKITGKSFLFPVPGRVRRLFGKIHNGLTDSLVFNDGIDVATLPNQDVYAAANGKVVAAGLHSLYGYYVILEHKGRLHSFYGYLSGIKMHVGQDVQRGEVIGNVGRSGYTSGQWLHFSILHKNKPVDPFKYLR